MRKRLPLPVVAGLVLVVEAACGLRAASGGTAPLRLGWHYAGLERITSATNATLFRKALAQPATQKLLKRLGDRLASAPERLAGSHLVDRSVKVAPKLRAMIADLARQPSFGEWRGAGKNRGEWVVILKADEATAKRWEQGWAALAGAFGAGKPEPANVNEALVKVARGQDGSPATAYGRVDGWVGVAVGNDPVAMLKRVAARVKAGLAADPGAWLELRSDLAGTLEQPRLPQLTISVTGHNERVKATATLRFAQTLSPPLEAWNIPTNIIREPLISFAAARGIAKLLEGLPWLQRTGLKPLPNQMFTWGLSLHPSQNYVAFPNPDPAGALKQASPGLIAEFDRQFPFLAPAKLRYQPDQHRLVVTNLIMAAAFLMPAPETAPGFVVGGFSLPLYLRGKPAPPALFEQVAANPKLLYYHWEITQSRVEMLWHVATYWMMMHAYLPPPAGGMFAGWLRDKGLTACLGNAVTQVTLESPHEIRVVRSSAIGFTAYELIRLAQWIDGKDWPACTKPVTVQEDARARHQQRGPGHPAKKRPAKRRSGIPKSPVRR